MILVTKPFLPPIEEYHRYLEEIWEREYLTNNGPLVQKLERDLKEFLDSNEMIFTTNGTIALQIGIKALELSGEVITTPFSYVATTSSIVWEGSEPVFVDIDEKTLNMDANLIEAAITDQTTAIIATHVFGNPCYIEEVQAIANKHRLKVIYDASHCFGMKYKGQSIFNYGDVSTCSFHATKLFHTVEGGAIFTSDQALLTSMTFMRNFGHDGPGKFSGVGINGKNSEYHAAMGLTNLKYMPEILSRRKEQYDFYLQGLEHKQIAFQKLVYPDEYNHAYCPIILESEEVTLKVQEHLKNHEILTRRYFYPSLSSLDYVQGNTPVCDDVSSRILCLPLYHSLSLNEQKMIISKILEIV